MITQSIGRRGAKSAVMPLGIFEIERRALLQRIQAARDVKLIALLAPSGFGKTTLLAQHARNIRGKFAWLYLDKACPNEDALLEALAGVQHFPSKGIKSPELAAEQLNKLQENFSLLIDEIEQLGASASEWLLRFIATLGEGHQVLVTGHSTGNLPIVKMVATGQAIVIEQNALSFTDDETQELLKKNKVNLSAQSLQRETEGWPIGISLAALVDSPFINIDRLIHDLLNQLPLNLVNQLTEMSLFEIWTEAQAEEIGIYLQAGWLQKMIRVGLPITMLDSKKYRPHQLLKKVLEEKLKENATRCQQLRESYVEYLLKHNDHHMAMQQCLKAGWIEKTIEIATVLVHNNQQQWDAQQMKQALGQIPVHKLSTELAAHSAGAYIETGDLVTGTRMLMELESKAPYDFTVLHWLATLAEYQGDANKQLQYANRALQKTTDPQTRFIFLRHRMSAHLNADNPQASMKEAEDLLKQSLHEPVTYRIKSAAMFFLQMSCMMLGEFERSEQFGRKRIELDLSSGYPYRALSGQNMLIFLYNLQGRRQEALALLDKCINYAETHQHMMLMPLLIHKGDWFLLGQQHKDAAQSYQQALDMAQGMGEFKIYSEMKLLDALWLTGIVPKFIPKPEVSSNPSTWGQYLFLRGKMAWVNKDFKEAKELLNQINTHDQMLYTRAQAYLADIARQQHKLRQEQIDATTRWPDKLGSNDILLIDQNALKELYAELNKKPETQQRFLFAQQTNSQQTKSNDMPIEILTLGRIQVWVGGQEVQCNLYRANCLLVFLAIEGSSSREKIIENLWPNDDRDHTEYARVVIRRLREALAGTVPFNPVVFKNGQYSLNPRLSIRLDVGQLETETKSPEELEAAFAVYKGSFLPKADSEWIEYQRTSFLDKAVEIGLKLVNHYMSNDTSKATQTCKRLLQIDPACEPADELLARLKPASKAKKA